MLSFKLLAGRTDNGKFIVLKANKFIPGNFAVFVPGRVEDFAHTGRPIPVFLEKLRQRDCGGPLLSDVGRVVQDSR